MPKLRQNHDPFVSNRRTDTDGDVGLRHPRRLRRKILRGIAVPLSRMSATSGESQRYLCEATNPYGLHTGDPGLG
jgi:hypothetical protein